MKPFILFLSLIMATALAGCVSSSEHERVRDEALRTGNALNICTEDLSESSDRVEQLEELRDRLRGQMEEARARRESLGELMAECQFSVRERQDEYREQQQELDELRVELENTKARLEPFLASQKQEQEISGAVETLVADLSVIFADEVAEGQAIVNSGDGKAMLVLNNRILFKGSGTKLTEQGRKNLEKAADSFVRIGISSLEVEGHTDNTRPGKELSKLYPDNWALTSVRAASAASFLVEKGGIPRDFVVASGLSDKYPIADNSTVEGRAMNRRLVLWSTPALMDEEPESDEMH